MTMRAILTHSFSLSFCLSLHVVVARAGHTSALLSDGSVLVMGGSDGEYDGVDDVWKTMDGGASWILVTSSAGWGGKKMLIADAITTVCLVSLMFRCVRNPPCHDYFGLYISDYENGCFL